MLYGNYTRLSRGTLWYFGRCGGEVGKNTLKYFLVYVLGLGGMKYHRFFGDELEEWYEEQRLLKSGCGKERFGSGWGEKKLLREEEGLGHI